MHTGAYYSVPYFRSDLCSLGWGIYCSGWLWVSVYNLFTLQAIMNACTCTVHVYTIKGIMVVECWSIHSINILDWPSINTWSTPQMALIWHSIIISEESRLIFTGSFWSVASWSTLASIHQDVNQVSIKMWIQCCCELIKDIVQHVDALISPHDPEFFWKFFTD